MVLPIVRRVFAAVLAGVILGTASLASAAALGQREALPNALVLVVSEQHAVPIVAIQLLLRTGSMDDPQGKSGLANLTAQLLSQGTTTRTAPQISEAIEFIGASLDIEPGLETTTITLSLLSKDLDLGLDLLADVLLNPAFRADDVKRKVEEIKAGIKRDQEDPSIVSIQAFMKALYGAHPLGNPVEGVEASLDTVTRDDVVGFHAKYFRPDQAIFAIVGDVSEPDLRARIQARFGAWQAKGPLAAAAPVSPVIGQKVVKAIQRDVTQANINLGGGGIRRDNPDYYAVQVMNYLLGGAFSSYLIATIRDEKGWAYDVSSAFSARKLSGEFGISMQTKNEVADQAIAAALAQVRRMRDTLVDEQTLKDAKAYLTGSFPLRLDTSNKVAGLLASIEYFGLGLDYPDRYAEWVNAVTVADVQRVAQKYLDPNKYVLAVVADLKTANIRE